MQNSNLYKITKYNGFDKCNSDNARQNNYAWSMVEFNGYIYVGTGRNIVYNGLLYFGLTPTSSVTPEIVGDNAEIWRYPICGCNRNWERVYRADDSLSLMGLRSMSLFTNSRGETGIYCGVYPRNNQFSFMLKSTDGINWEILELGLDKDYNTRTTLSYRGRLYTGILSRGAITTTTLLFSNDDPDNKAWTQVDTDDIDGEIYSMIEFNGYMYIGVASVGGFSVWKSRNPEKGKWVCVVDRGAGDALNELPMSMEVFNDYLYVGSAIYGGIYSTDLENRFVLPKGFDLIRISKEDRWEVIIGGEPIVPTRPRTGRRNKARYSSGRGNLFNGYCWNLRNYNGRLYLSTWDSAILYYNFYRDMIVEYNKEDWDKTFEFIKKAYSEIDLDKYRYELWIEHLLKSLKNYPQSFGSDLMYSDDGERFSFLNRDGLGNVNNYGIRNMLSASDGKLYMGTANPYDGCEVWVMNK